jgi:hypothetical protein
MESRNGDAARGRDPHLPHISPKSPLRRQLAPGPDDGG